MTIRLFVIKLIRIFTRLEKSAHYNWRFGILVAVIVSLPLIIGEFFGHRSDGVIGALAGWFIAIGIPPRTVRHRLLFLGRRLIILITATILGVIVAQHTVWAALAIVILALLIPIPWITITPLITLIMGMNTPQGIGNIEHIIAFTLGGIVALLVLLLPAAASPIAPEFVVLRIGEPLHKLTNHLRRRSPEVRYATQAAVAVCILYLVLTLLHWPHVGWVLVGILTTLRPSWDVIEARVIKRSIGMIGGAALTALMLVFSAHTGYWTTVAVIAVYGGLARPMRQFNYGLWPIFGTPVLLLLISLSEPLMVIDSVWRLGNNLLGAAVTLLAVTTLWPHDTQRPNYRI